MGSGMAQLPSIETHRLVLRPFALSDAPRVRELAGDRAIADTVIAIPHPYPDGLAEEWIAGHQKLYEDYRTLRLAITLKPERELIGSIGLDVDAANHKASLGYWIAKCHWNRGFCTEAAASVLEYAFERLGLNRVWAHHFTRNPASGRVLEKIGMQHEGRLRQAIMKWGLPEDVEVYGILRREYGDPV